MPWSLTFYCVSGHQRRAERTEAVEGFSQQPLLPIALHLPVAGADVIGDRETSDVGEGIFLLKGKNRKTATLPPHKSRSEVVRRCQPWCVFLFVRSQTPTPPPSPPPSKRVSNEHISIPGTHHTVSSSGGERQLCSALYAKIYISANVKIQMGNIVYLHNVAVKVKQIVSNKITCNRVHVCLVHLFWP